MDHDLSVALQSLAGCVGWITALIFLVVGLVPVRKAYPTAGYLIAGGGALRWLFFCCQTLPTTLAEAEMYELLETMGPLPSFVGLLMWLLSTAAILAGLVVLARHLTARRATATGGA